MISPETVEAALRPWMQQHGELLGALVIDLGEQTVIAALLPPNMDAAKIAGPIYKAWRVREELFSLVENNGRDMLFWGDHYAYALIGGRRCGTGSYTSLQRAHRKVGVGV